MPSAVALTPSNFALLCEVVEAVARHSGLPQEDADDFSQSAHLKLLERGYAPLALFSGRSSLRTYLTVVVKRLLLDWRNARFGKWRPSSCARRLGRAAVELDRLISRDGHTVDEAVAILQNRCDVPRTTTLRDLALRLPVRCRIHTIAAEDAEALGSRTFDDPVEAEQDAALRRRMLLKLRRACRQLSPDDQRLLHLRFERNLSVAAIASLVGTPSKPLYRRMNSICRSLRRNVAGRTAQSTTRARRSAARMQTRRTDVMEK